MSKKFKNDYRPKKSRLDLSDETKKGIIALLLFALALVVILSAFDLAGAAGQYLYQFSRLIFGWGFFLLPLGLILAGVVILQSLHRDLYGTPFAGVGLFILSFLGILQLFGPSQIESGQAGGYLGWLVAYPLLKGLGSVAGAIVLVTLLGVALLIIFNIPLKKIISAIFSLGKIKSESAANQGVASVKSEEGWPFGALMKKISPSPKFKVNTLQGSAAGAKIEVRQGEDKKAALAKKEDLLLLTSKMTLEDYQLPPLELLEADSGEPTSGDIKANASIIRRALQHFGIEVEMAEVNIGPTVTQYTLRPAQGIKLSRLTALQNDLSLALAAHPIRIEAPIPGRSLVGIEIPNKAAMRVRLRNLFEQPEFSQDSRRILSFALGRDVAGLPVYTTLERMPHLLVAGATGTGKTICLNALILSLLYRHAPNFLKLILIDPKRVEFPIYNGLPHLLTPVIVEAEKTINAMRWAVAEMERRFEILASVQARDAAAYNQKFVEGKIEEPLPYIVIVVDELADLMASHGREIEAAVVRLAQMARAVGIHLVLATQRPSVEVITGLIKANITSRVAFQVASQVDSRTVLDGAGAEKLLGNGDMLFLSAEAAKPRRLQGAYVADREVQKVVEFITRQTSIQSSYEEEVVKARPAAQGLFMPAGEFEGSDDELYEQAKEVVIQSGKASASLLQRRLRVGYARAARLLDMLEEHGIIGPGEGAKPREILVEGVKGIPGNPRVGEGDDDRMVEY